MQFQFLAFRVPRGFGCVFRTNGFCPTSHHFTLSFGFLSRVLLDCFTKNEILLLNLRPIPQNPRRRRELILLVAQSPIELNSPLIVNKNRQHDFRHIGDSHRYIFHILHDHFPKASTGCCLVSFLDKDWENAKWRRKLWKRKRNQPLQPQPKMNLIDVNHGITILQRWHERTEPLHNPLGIFDQEILQVKQFHLGSFGTRFPTILRLLVVFRTGELHEFEASFKI